jgi:hypothetical protein
MMWIMYEGVTLEALQAGWGGGGSCCSLDWVVLVLRQCSGGDTAGVPLLLLPLLVQLLLTLPVLLLFVQACGHTPPLPGPRLLSVPTTKLLNSSCSVLCN